uniref:Uncharacterized protein n=1 Tax=Anguilla anguilla TaxID=7936 RepID=A0A0E9VRM4_ANGAN
MSSPRVESPHNAGPFTGPEHTQSPHFFHTTSRLISTSLLSTACNTILSLRLKTLKPSDSLFQRTIVDS